MSNNTSTSCCNNCYVNSHNSNCRCVDSSMYPSVYYSHAMDYSYPEEMMYDTCGDYTALKYPPAMYSTYEDSYYYGAVHPPYYPTQYYPAPSFYWSKQQSQQQVSVSSGTMGSNFPAHAINSSSSNSSSDPLNALQNLTVSAGQPVQIMAQQPNSNHRISSAMCNSVIRPRSLGSGNIQRPLEKYSVIPQLTAKNIEPVQITQGQQILSSGANLPSNITISRLPNKNVIIKGEPGFSHSPSLSSSMSTPHSLDSSGTPVSGQSLSQTFHKPSSDQLYQNSPSSQSIHIAQHTSLIPPIVSVNQPIDSAKPATSSNISIPRPQASISEEEMNKVIGEIKRLKEKYLKTLKAILESQKKYPDEEIKVFKVLRNILESPASLSKPLFMKHVAKIEQYLVKAEQMLNNDITKSTSNLSNNSQTMVTVKALASNTKSLVSVDTSSSQKVKCKSESTTESADSRTISSLDIAFEEVCHQLLSTNPEILKKVQRGLVKYVESKGLLHSYFLPKRFILDDVEEDYTKDTYKRQRMSSLYDEDEVNSSYNILGSLDFNPSQGLDNGLESDPNQYTLCNYDKEDFKDYSLEEELSILKDDFEIEQLVEEDLSKQWSTYDTEWDGSVFYSLSYNKQTLPEEVPAMKVRIPEDYLYGRYVDWNLNQDHYPEDCESFLQLVRTTLLEEFSKINQYTQWSGITLLKVANVYRSSILSAKSNYQNQIIEFQKQD